MSETKQRSLTMTISVIGEIDDTDLADAVKKIRLGRGNKVVYTRVLCDADIVGAAERIHRNEYRADVEGVAEDARRAIIDGEIADREALDEWLHQTIDGHGRVIYTARAKDGLNYSDNAGAYVDEFGEEGATEDGEPAYSRLMFAAMRADVIAELEDELVNADAYCKVCRKAGKATAAERHSDTCEEHAHDDDDDATAEE